MNNPLKVSIGGATDKGIKEINQDFIGSHSPSEPQLSGKGIALAVADGISSSKVSQEASEAAVNSFLNDYYCTSDAWSVKNSVYKVVRAINSWLFAQTRNSPYRFDKDKGYICTFSAIVFKSNSAHIFHSGDSRVYRLSDTNLEQLTEDHRRQVSDQQSYLTRALGIHQTLEIDYITLQLELGDIYILATDGLYEFVNATIISNVIHEHSCVEKAANTLLNIAKENGSDDNISIQIVRIDNIPEYQLAEVQQLTKLPTPPQLAPRTLFDGYEITQEIYISSRSHVFLAKDLDSQENVVIKVPSTELSTDTKYLERFMLEEWIAKRINNPHVAKVIIPTRKRNFLYLAIEYIEGISLNQWIIDNPKPKLETVRNIIEQIAKGLQAFHRQEMIHQDIRPNNIMIDNYGTVKIIDFGSTFIAGVSDSESDGEMRGTIRYSAPEYFLGQLGTQQSDIYSLGVIAYQMLSGKFPYSAKIAQANSKSAQRKLTYRSIIDDNSVLPVWIDDTLNKALQIDPVKRYSELSEFIQDLRTPNSEFLARTRAPLIQRDPVMFWQAMCFILVIVLLIQQIE
ncbi:protein kinase domain-containing protein [Colwellia sp. E150_009]